MGGPTFFPPRPQANWASSARIRRFRQRAFSRRSAFWKTSARLPVFWRLSPLFPFSFPARAFRRRPSPEPMPVFFSFSFYCSIGFVPRERRHSGRTPAVPSGNAAYLLYAGSLVHEKKRLPCHTVYNKTGEARRPLKIKRFFQKARLTGGGRIKGAPYFLHLRFHTPA